MHNLEDVENIGPTVKRLRIERGMNQLDVAAKAGTSIGTISKLENGQRGASVRTLAAVADALGVGLTDIFHEARKGASDEHAR